MENNTWVSALRREAVAAPAAAVQRPLARDTRGQLPGFHRCVKPSGYEAQNGRRQDQQTEEAETKANQRQVRGIFDAGFRKLVCSLFLLVLPSRSFWLNPSHYWLSRRLAQHFSHGSGPSSKLSNFTIALKRH